MKGLRQEHSPVDIKHKVVGFLPCDLNEGITTLRNGLSNSTIMLYFYLVTWMKGLRLLYLLIHVENTIQFLPCDLNEGITTDLSFPALITLKPINFYLVTWMKGLRLDRIAVHFKSRDKIFTLWPEWRDYDLRHINKNSLGTIAFLPCDLNEGITTVGVPYYSSRRSIIFTLWPEWRDYDAGTWVEVTRATCPIFTLWPEWRDYDTGEYGVLVTQLPWFLPCDLNEGITTWFV